MLEEGLAHPQENDSDMGTLFADSSYQHSSGLREKGQTERTGTGSPIQEEYPLAPSGPNLNDYPHASRHDARTVVVALARGVAALVVAGLARRAAWVVERRRVRADDRRGTGGCANGS